MVILNSWGGLLIRQTDDLRLHRASRFRPSLVSAEDRRDVFVPVMQQEERRTGARVFFLSGAVGDDPLVLVDACKSRVHFNFIVRSFNLIPERV